MNAEEAKRFVSGRLFAYNCFEGTTGAGRIYTDGSVVGSIQLRGEGPVRYVALPAGTLKVKGESYCATVRGLPFEPCFNLDKKDERNFRGSVSGMGFAYCDFRRQGAAQMLLARAVARPRSLRPPVRTGSVEVSAVRVETPQLERQRIEPVKSETRSELSKSESAPELRRSTD